MTCDDVDIGHDAGHDAAEINSNLTIGPSNDGGDGMHSSTNDQSTRPHDFGDRTPFAQASGVQPGSPVCFVGMASGENAREQSSERPTIVFGLADQILAVAAGIRQRQKRSVSTTRRFNGVSLISFIALIMICIKDTMEVLVTLLKQWGNHSLAYPHHSSQEIESIRNDDIQMVRNSSAYGNIYCLMCCPMLARYINPPCTSAARWKRPAE